MNFKAMGIIFTVMAITGFVSAQFPLNGDTGALNKMKQAKLIEKMTVERLMKRTAAIEERAIHFMKAMEKAQRIQEFISRGSTQMPGGDEPIEANANVGEQIIDPRTPTGFGNPFFRQINIEQNIEMQKIISAHELKQMRLADEPLDPVISSGWVTVEARGAMRESDKRRRTEFMSLWWASPNRIIRRLCESCDNSRYKEIYYRRITEDGMTKKILDAMVDGPFKGDACLDDACTTTNECYTDFTLHSTYKDAKEGANEWKHCCSNDNGGIFGFPGVSGPVDVDVTQYNLGNEGQPDYAFYVEDSSWIAICGNGVFDIRGEKSGIRIEHEILDQARQLLHESANAIVRRVCANCDTGYKELYYRRFTTAPDDIVEILLRNFEEKKGNVLNRDFKIFSSYNDALADTNAWELCGKPEEMMGFPARCKPTENSTVPDIWSRHQENDLSRWEAGKRHTVFYIEKAMPPETDEWMTEDDEMAAFLSPKSDLKENDDIVCDIPSYDDTYADKFDYFSTDLKPYVFQDQIDQYSGWYDLQGCGRCHDWCGWFSKVGSGFDGGMNPYYKSWTLGNDVFACLTGSDDLPSLKYSGYDSTEVTGGFVHPEFKSPMSLYSGFLKFFPSKVRKCEGGLDSLSPFAPAYEYVGCYKDGPTPALPISGGQLSVDNCFTYCKDLGYHYFGRQGPGICSCGGASADDNSYAQYGESSESSETSSGIENWVSDNIIRARGWVKCFSGTYKQSHNVNDAILNSCQGSEVMYSCRSVGNPIWKLIGYGSRDKAFTPTSSRNTGTEDGNIQWYFNGEKSMGFADAGDTLALSSCDTNDKSDPNRMCWHMSNGVNVRNGWRCGDRLWLNSNADWERAVWVKGSRRRHLAASNFTSSNINVLENEDDSDTKQSAEYEAKDNSRYIDSAPLTLQKTPSDYSFNERVDISSTMERKLESNKYNSDTFVPETCGDCDGNDIGIRKNCVWKIDDELITRTPTAPPQPTAAPTFDSNPFRCNIGNPCTRGEAAGMCCSLWGWCGISSDHCSPEVGCLSNCWSRNPTQAPITTSPTQIPSEEVILPVCEMTNYVGDNDNTGGGRFEDGPFAKPIECIKISNNIQGSKIASISIKPFAGEYGPIHGEVSSEQIEWCADVANGELIVRVDGRESDFIRQGMEYVRFTLNTGYQYQFNADGLYGSSTGDASTFNAPIGCVLGGIVGKSGSEVDTIGAIWVSNPFNEVRRSLKETCGDFGEKYALDFGGSSLPYQYLLPKKDDQYAGWYDIQRCGKCMDWCGWVGKTGSGSGVNPRYKERIGTDYFACKPAGGYTSKYGLTSIDHFKGGFRYQKCEGKSASTPAYRKDRFIGCFRDASDRALGEKIGSTGVGLNHCIDSCRKRGYHYAGRQWMGECWCGGIRASDTSYAKHGQIEVTDPGFCNDCESDFVGNWKNCVFKILDQFDPEVERSRHPCTHIPFTDIRRYCYVSCRDQEEKHHNLLTCKKLSVIGQQNLNLEIAAWLDSPVCENKECLKRSHPLGEDVAIAGGVF